MSDSHRRYNAINQTLLQGYGSKPSGHLQRHLNTLALLICAIVGAGHTQLSQVATCSPEKTKVESRIKKFKRWLVNEKVSLRSYLPEIASAKAALNDFLVRVRLASNS
jgi:hypothetical protein